MAAADPLHILVVSEKDLADLLPLMRGYCAFYHSSPSDADLLAMSRALIADPGREGQQLLGRDAGGTAVGFATLLWTWDTTAAARVAVMEDLFVVREARGTGVGRQLIASCPGARIPVATLADRARQRGRAAALRRHWSQALELVRLSPADHMSEPPAPDHRAAIGWPSATAQPRQLASGLESEVRARHTL
jgi:GNAT superfamily N-acetyltransferase